MGKMIPASHMDLFEKRAVASLATLMPSGCPQVTPVWVMYTEPYVIVNSAVGRVKDRNMRRDARVAIEVRDPGNPYRYVTVQGLVVEITEEGARDVINALSDKYLGQPVYGGPPDETRVTYKILPQRVHVSG
ncbi:MAG: PPOX class F420-dependent oxidoreductase [Anaerolineae bacterium]|jgi:PPOX class probable F420-dependent enzyme|nr:PPOX class F420-dependent oxidoreductase [Anaerolineae bacterium]